VSFPISLCATLIAISAALVTLPSEAAQIAASIEYDFCSAHLGCHPISPAGGRRSASSRSRPSTDSADAALWQPGGKQPADTTLIVMVHGSGGSYQQAPQSGLGPRLAAKGYASLAINTRQHDEKINTDNFLDVRRDIDAAVQVARALGYKTLVLQGQSLGNIQVQFYAATNWDRDIKAVVLLGAFIICHRSHKAFSCRTRSATGSWRRPP
jgi:pimeloyl-ACP methyl ester carboxylesterase